VYRNLSTQQEEVNKDFPLPLIGKKAAKNAPERIFSAAISGDFQKLFRQPLDEAVATLTEVVFDLKNGIGSTTIRGRRRSTVQRHIQPKN
jgi:hypothetical protein